MNPFEQAAGARRSHVEGTPGPLRRVVAWTKPNPIGAEVAVVTLESDRLAAVGTAIGSDPEPYRLDYELTTAAGFVTRLVRVTTTGEGWTRRLHLRHDGRGNWTSEAAQTGHIALPDPGGQASEFAGALDPDLGLSPLFNTMPVLRHRLLETGSDAADFLMVWISVPDLHLHASRQRYTHVRAAGETPAVVLFESVGEGEDFRAEIQFDTDGLVLDYPQIATRIRPA
jgi:hypothetical protein